MKASRLAALTLAGVMALSSFSISALADEAIPTDGNPISVTDGSTQKYVGDITTDEDWDEDCYNLVVADNGSTVTVTGDLTTDFDCFNIIVADNGSSVTLTGNITGDGYEDYAANASNGATIEINGDISVYAYGSGTYVHDGGTIIVNGDITGVEGAYGVSADGTDSYTTVNGNISVGGQNAVGVQVGAGAQVTVNGDISAIDGDYVQAVGAYDGAKVIVNGDVYQGGNATDSEAVLIQDSQVIINGSVSSEVYGILFRSDKDDVNEVIVVEDGIYGKFSTFNFLGYSNEDAINPTIVTKSLATGEDGRMFWGASDEVADRVLASVNYIISAESMSITGASAITVDDKTYTVAHDGDQITIQPVVDKGYKLNGIDFGSYASTVVDNGDGTYTITVNSKSENGVLGDLVFTMDLQKIKKTPAKKTAKVGDKVTLANSSWTVIAVDEQTGKLTLASSDELTEEQMNDLDALKDTLLTAAELKYAEADANGAIFTQITAEAAAEFFNGSMNHVTIVADPAILNIAK